MPMVLELRNSYTIVGCSSYHMGTQEGSTDSDIYGLIPRSLAYPLEENIYEVLDDDGDNIQKE